MIIVLWQWNLDIWLHHSVFCSTILRVSSVSSSMALTNVLLITTLIMMSTDLIQASSNTCQCLVNLEAKNIDFFNFCHHHYEPEAVDLSVKFHPNDVKEIHCDCKCLHKTRERTGRAASDSLIRLTWIDFWIKQESWKQYVFVFHIWIFISKFFIKTNDVSVQ